MGTSRMAGDGFANDLMMSCVTAIVRSSDDGIGIAKSEGNQAMVLVILSALIALIHTV